MKKSFWPLECAGANQLLSGGTTVFLKIVYLLLFTKISHIREVNDACRATSIMVTWTNDIVLLSREI